MIDLWPLVGIVIITVGFALRLNTLLVILTSGVVTGLVADLNILEILSVLGASFTKNRYMSLFILILAFSDEKFTWEGKHKHMFWFIKELSGMLSYINAMNDLFIYVMVS